jgi:hypothetical protein
VTVGKAGKRFVDIFVSHCDNTVGLRATNKIYFSPSSEFIIFI